MKYSPSARDGVFVVEVQQGVRRSPSSSEPTTKNVETSVSISNQCALIHNPPDKFVFISAYSHVIKLIKFFLDITTTRY